MLGKGLGTLWVQDNSGNIIDCDSFTNIFNSACWGFGTPISALPPGSPVFQTTSQGGGTAPQGGGTTPQPTAVDCTQMWNALTNSTCHLSDFLGSGSGLIVMALMLGGVFLVAKAMK